MTDQELQQKYPAYSKSIFADFKPDNSEVLGWQQNVLQKVKGDNILPHYIEKDRDFDTFWGWITHFFAIIVYFARNFKKFFTDYTSYLNEIGEFMRERDYIQDSRVQINKDLTIPLAEEIYHKIFCGYKLINNVAIPTPGYNCTDYLPITNGAIITLKALGYNESLGEYNGSAINSINISWYYADKTIGGGSDVFNITESQAKLGYRFSIPSSNDNPFCYIKISYLNFGNPSLPTYLGIFLEGEGTSFETEKTEENIFSVHSDFRKRGTFKGSSLIKKILESKKEDNFYADYLSQKNTGWFLNKNSPTFGGLFKNVKIDSIVANEIFNASGYTIVTMKEQYFMLNQNTSLIVKWKGDLADSVAFNISIYDKNKNLLSDVPILGNWVFDSVNHILTPSLLGGAVVNPKYNSEEGLNVAELAIELIDNSKSAIFSTDTFDKERFLDNLNKLYLFSKYNNSKTNEAYYLRVTSVVLIGSSVPYVENDYNINFETGLYLRKLPTNLGFLNNKQYYICCFKNNGSYSDETAKEIISQKIIPYNGYRVFIDNSFYKNNINVALDLKEVYFNKVSKRIHLEITGGVPPYEYLFDAMASRVIPIVSYLQTYEPSADYGTHIIKVTDSLGENLFVKVSCQPYNEINYKFKLYVSKDNSIQVFIKLFGGTETSYNVSKYTYTYPFVYDENNQQLLDENNLELVTTEFTESTGDAKKIISANVWVDITSIIGDNFSKITPNVTLYIRDNGIPAEEINWLISEYSDLELSLQDLFKDFALDIYDNGKGELVN